MLVLLTLLGVLLSPEGGRPPVTNGPTPGPPPPCTCRPEPPPPPPCVGVVGYVICSN